MKRLSSSEHLPSIILMTIALIIGLMTIRNYGESWDELQLYKYADNSIAAYSTWPRSGEIPITGGYFENYAPAFMMLSKLVTQAFKNLSVSWIESDIHHLFYFLTFLLGAWSFFEICKRWMGQNAALGSTLLFASQPILWGHAFINPKDTTLLSLMLLSVHLGLRMHDSLFGPQTDSAFDRLTSAWASLTQSKKRSLVIATLIWLVAILALFGGTPLWHTWFDSSVRATANGESTLLSPLILGFASNLQKVAPEIYIQKLFVAFLQARAVFFWASTLVLIWLYRKHLDSVVPVLGIILLASIALGFTSSIRIFGPLAGILVAQHAIRHSGKRSILAVATYALLAIFVMYATWPYLWSDPIGHLVETITVMSQHFWTGTVLFNGIEYAATDLSSSYIPVLLAIQLTEPVWVLCLIGLAATIYSLKKRRDGNVDLLVFTFIWLLIPLMTFILLRPTMFDNFRHSFFILPMVFVLAGVALDQVKYPLLQGILILTLITPGVIGIIRLHPYEYIYYNSFAGGVSGAFRKFELDYWGTSYREIALELNAVAPQSSKIWAEGPTHIFEIYARSDIEIYSTYEAERADHYDYVVTLSRHDDDLQVYPDAPIVFSVTRDTAVLAVIKKP